MDVAELEIRMRHLSEKIVFLQARVARLEQQKAKYVPPSVFGPLPYPSKKGLDVRELTEEELRELTKVADKLRPAQGDV